MPRARRIWEDERLPALPPKRPWYGYPLGPWPAEWEEETEVKGQYDETGETGRRARHGELTTPTAPLSLSASQLVGLAFERGPFRWFTGWRLDQSLWRRRPARKDELVDA